MSASESNESLIREKIKNSKTFCVFPWIHVHVSPKGIAAPCCISGSCSKTEGMGNSNNRLMDIVNNPTMNKLRLDMINGIKSDECNTCYQLEEQGIQSFRIAGLESYPDIIEDAINTNEDGSLSEFKMQYFDMRFSNICNFKCRTCGSDFSSQWEQENSRNNLQYAETFPKSANKELLQDVIDQVKHFKQAYFAGGEPLLMEEHYILLEEMIRQGRTDIELIYNSNISNIKYKNRDLFGLWKHFKKNIRVYASIDHVKERAEYIRHGTNWGTIEQNIIALKQQDFVQISMNTVLSIFNFLTIDNFYEYLLTNNFYEPDAPNSSLYCMSTPFHLSCHSMPIEFKHKGNESLERAISLLAKNLFNSGQIDALAQARSWALSQDTWLDKDHNGITNKEKFRTEVERLDKIRGEKFEKVFPELVPLLEQTYG